LWATENAGCATSRAANPKEATPQKKHREELIQILENVAFDLSKEPASR
jgi:hypothetical protein